MGNVYNAQDALKIRLTCSQDITGATVKRIKYRKPDGTESYWTATVEDASSGIIYYNVASGDIDDSGLWVFWAYITFSDGKSAPGEPVYVYFYDEGYE